ncbi:MAG TPA: 3-hydroxyacyl-[acyl-carrier-protein] dehydratase FabZ, partial [Acidimicrobiales bacterium]|nr:3-hydroxyacyl-[acyl-carrier-protein] dehydratase FabZ [Acidimicrobiales bacterium]
RYAGRLPLFGGIDRARFRRQVVPGDTLDLEVRLTQMSSRAGRGHGVASVAGERAAEVDLLFVLVST